jgi:hypothetical protein
MSSSSSSKKRENETIISDGLFVQAFFLLKFNAKDFNVKIKVSVN